MEMPELEPRPHTIQNPGRTPGHPGPSRHSYLRMGLGLPQKGSHSAEGTCPRARPVKAPGPGQDSSQL